MKELKDYSQFKGNLQGNPIIGTVGFLGGLPIVYRQFASSMMQMVQYNSEKIPGVIEYDTVETSLHSQARNTLAGRFVGEWLLMLDADVQFDPDLLYRMIYSMEKYNVPVLTGVYLYRKEPHLPVLYTWNKKLKKYETIKGWTTESERIDIFDIDGAGAGCLLVQKWVIHAIIDELGEQPFSIRKPFDNPKSAYALGEDLSFFDRLRQLNIQVACDPNITVDHLTIDPIVVGKQYEPHVIQPLDFEEKKV